MAAADNAKHPAKLIGVAEDLVPITTFADAALIDPRDDGTFVWTFPLITRIATGATYIARALVCSCDGTATVITAEGRKRTGIPLTKGWNPGPRVARVLAWTPSVVAGTIWGVK